MTGGGLIWVNEAYVLARVILIVTYLYLVLSLSLSLSVPHPTLSLLLTTFACLLACLQTYRAHTEKEEAKLTGSRFPY
jgi:hypothetical protein